MLPTLRRVLCAVAVLLPCAAVQALEIYLPRTRAHIKCKFADGSYFEYKDREKWYFYFELIPHAQTTSPLNSTLRYVDERGRRHHGIGTTHLDCVGVGKRNGRVFWPGGFQEVHNRMIESIFGPAKSNQFSHDSTPRPNETPHLKPVLAKLQSTQFVYARHSPTIVAVDVRQLLLQQPLTAMFGAVTYVLQSRSSDFGQTWTMPVLTKDAKLYEIGPIMAGQSWAPELEVIVPDSSVRRR